MWYILIGLTHHRQKHLSPSSLIVDKNILEHSTWTQYGKESSKNNEEMNEYYHDEINQVGLNIEKF
jgi:hypothetical protein